MLAFRTDSTLIPRGSLVASGSTARCVVPALEAHVRVPLGWRRGEGCACAPGGDAGGSGLAEQGAPGRRRNVFCVNILAKQGCVAGWAFSSPCSMCITDMFYLKIQL